MRIIIFIIAQCMTLFLYGQGKFPIKVIVDLPQPFPTTREEAVKFESYPFIQLINTDPFSRYELALSGSITSDNGINANFDPSTHPPVAPIVIGPGEMITLSVQDLQKFNPNITEGDILYNGIDEKELIKTNQIPEGSYTVCIRAFDWQKGDPLSEDLPFGCSVPVTVIRPEPPFLVLPREGDVFADDYSFIEVRWLPLVGAKTPVEYNVEILRTDGADSYDLFREGRKLFFEKSGLMANVIIIDESFLKFAPGEYAVRVTAYDPFSPLNIGNNGHSEIHVFNIEEIAPKLTIINPKNDDSLVYDDIMVEWNDIIDNPRKSYFLYLWDKDGQDVDDVIESPFLKSFGPEISSSLILNTVTEGLSKDKEYVIMVHGHKHSRDYYPLKSDPVVFSFVGEKSSENGPSSDCGGECESPMPQDISIYSGWNNGDEVQIGFFRMLLKNISKQSGVFSGQAEIIAGDLIERNIEVNLNNIKINRSGKVFDGEAIATATANITQFTSRSSRSFGFWQSFLYASGGNGLPYGKGDLLFTTVKFTPLGAKADLVSALRLSGNRLQAGEALWFVKEDVPINPGGFKSNDIYIGLDTDVVFSDNSNIEYTFKAKAQPTSGGGPVTNSSKVGDNMGIGKVNTNLNNGVDFNNHQTHTGARFDCDGVRTVFSKGTVDLNPSTGMDFDKVSGKITGYFNSTFTNWSSATGFVNFHQTGKSQNLNETLDCSDELTRRAIRLTKLKPFSFGFCSAIFDHNFNESPGDISSSWTGIYFDKMKVSLPKALKDVNGKRLQSSIIGRYDAQGFHTQTEAEIIGSLGLIGKWVGVVTNVNLEVERNIPRETLLEGSLILPFAYPLSTVKFDMHFYNIIGRSSTIMTIDDLDGLNFKFTPWNADMTLNSSSRISATVVRDNIKLETDFYGTLNFRDNIGGVVDNDLKDIEFSGMVIGNDVHTEPGIHVNSFNAPNGDYKIGGYEAQVKGFNITNYGGRDKAKSILEIDYEFKLDDLNLGFLGETKFQIHSEQNRSGQVQTYSLDKANIARFNLEIDIPVIKATGEIVYTNNDVGSEFKGRLQVKMMGALGLESLEIKGRFGKRENFSYWTVGCSADLAANVELFSGLQMRSFGGGMFYNMGQSRGIGTRYVFTPVNNGEFGIEGTVGIVHVTPGLYTGSFSLSTIFGDGGLSEVTLRSSGDFWYEGRAKSPRNAKLVLDGRITLNFSDRPFFEGEFNYNLNINEPLFSITGRSNRDARSIGFHFGSSTWYIRMGRSSSPINASLSVKNSLGGGAKGPLLTAGAETYLETGKGMPFNFGLAASIDGENEFKQELLFADEFKLDYHYGLGVAGSLGRNNTSCSGINPSSFYGYLQGDMEISGGLQYYDRCDDYNPLDWDWDGDGDGGCEKWRTVINLDLDVSGSLYGVGPTGANLSVELGFTVFKKITFNKNLQVGSKCN